MGGSTGTGITSGLDKPRQKYDEAGRVKQDAQRIFDIGVGLRKDNLIKQGSMVPGSVPSFLTGFGLNLLSATPRGNIFQTAATAAQQPFQQFQQARLLEQEKARARRDAALSSAVASAVDLERERIEATAGTDYAKKQEIDLLSKIYDNKVRKIEEELAGLQPNDPSRQSLEAEVDKLREENKLEGLQLYINPDMCIDCGACIPECPPDAIFETEDDCIDEEGNDESVRKNYEFFDLEWEG